MSEVVDVQLILDLHAQWLRGEPGGKKADFRKADLGGADFRWADCRKADFREADFREADLCGADFREADLSGAGLIILQTDIWTCYIQKESIRIGCQYHAANDWFSFSDDKINEMDRRALAWWKRWKPAIQAVHLTF